MNDDFEALKMFSVSLVNQVYMNANSQVYRFRMSAEEQQLHCVWALLQHTNLTAAIKGMITYAKSSKTEEVSRMGNNMLSGNWHKSVFNAIKNFALKLGQHTVWTSCLPYCRPVRGVQIHTT